MLAKATDDARAARGGVGAPKGSWLRKGAIQQLLRCRRGKRRFVGLGQRKYGNSCQRRRVCLVVV